MGENDSYIEPELCRALNKRIEALFTKILEEFPAFRVPLKVLPSTIQDHVSEMQRRVDVAENDTKALKKRVDSFLERHPDFAEDWYAQKE